MSKTNDEVKLLPMEPSTTESPADLYRPDKENAFLLYAVFCGDVARTAAALSVDEAVVKDLATQNGWDKKLKPIIDLKQSTRAGDVERAINRALNFVDAHRMRVFLARVIHELTGMGYTDLKAFLFPESSEPGSGGLVKVKKFSTRSLADLASAMEKCQALTYLALNDTATERRERNDEGDDGAGDASEMHVRLAKAMSEAGAGTKGIEGMLADAQMAVAAERASGSVLPITESQLS